MKTISLEELAKLLEEGFNGQVLFSGNVEVNQYRRNEFSGPIYKASGGFRLTGLTLDCVRKDENNFSLAQVGDTSAFYFRKSKGKIHIIREEKSASLMRVPITLREGALLEITNPDDILY